ncbi:MAG: YfiR family protein [Proteobacteria bacterium]|nr:YfiR family protein [Pseudomonadota bacterium]
MRIVNLQKSIFILMLASALSFSNGLFAGESELDTQWEYEQKAKIIKYLVGKVVWPKTAVESETFNICVLGNLEYKKAIDAINGETINNHKILVSKSPSINKLSENCQIIYIAKSEADKANKLISSYSSKPVLLLGDMDNFALAGGGMNFIITKESIGLTINNEALKKSNLQFDMKGFQITVVPQETDLGK